MFESEEKYNKEQYEKYFGERFVYKEELESILQIIKTRSNYRILILGDAGTGKTTLLHMLCKADKRWW